MRNIIKLQQKLKSLCKEKHKRDETFKAFGLSQCHQLDWEIGHTIKMLKEVLS